MRPGAPGPVGTAGAVRAVGERAVMLDAAAISPGRQPAALATALRHLAASRGIEVVDLVPGAATVLVVATSRSELDRLLAALADLDGDGVDAGRGEPAVVELPVRYDGPDLAGVADATGMSVAEVVRRHRDVTYRAAFCGFAPGFAYLTGLDPALHLPRRTTFRPSVPAGSLAIADRYTAVYPRSSPGGWHLLGSTTATMFDPTRAGAARASLIAPGDVVHLVTDR